MKMYAGILCILAAATLSACAPQKPLTYDQQVLQEAQAECTTAATSMNDAPHNSNNKFWKSYFEMCMRTRFDVTDAQLKTLWY